MNRMSRVFFSGSITALITPMNRDGSLDFASFENIVDWQIREGTSALCAVGTTGECPTISHSEHHAVVERAVKAASGRVPVIAGAGSNSTTESITLAQHAERVGASAVLVVTPYYNKPTQEGLYRHFMSIADSISIPIILYNIPSRSVIDISVATMARLAKHGNIIGVKDSTTDLMRPLQVRAAIEKPFNQLSGEDGTAVAFLATGGDGCISVTSNIAPALCASVQNAWKDGRIQEAISLQDKLLPLHETLFCESNPAPVKYAASLLGLAGETCRLPLAPIREESRKKIREALKDVGLLS